LSHNFGTDSDAGDTPSGPRDAARGDPRAPQEGSARFIPPTMLREGDYWTLLYRGRLTRVRHTKGITYLAQLVAHPWESMHVSDLYGRGRARSVEGASPRPIESDRKAVTGRIRAAMGAVQAYDATLGEHLASAISTGTYCCYSPRADSPVTAET
jgi:hypothetical protein